MYEFRVLCAVCDLQVDFHGLAEAEEFKEYHDLSVSYSVNGSSAYSHVGIILSIEEDNSSPVIRRRTQ